MEIIGNIYLPINNILLLSNNIKEQLNIPSLNDNDIKIIKNLKNSNQLSFLGGYINDTKKIILDSSNYLKIVKELSFYDFLLNKMINEAKIYVSNFNIKFFLLENINQFYLNEPVIYWLMRSLSTQIKKSCQENEISIGIKFNNNNYYSMDIACRNNLNFIFAKEQDLPELYLQRNLSKKQINIFIDYKQKYNNEFFLYDGFIINKMDEFYNIYQNIKNKPLILKIKNINSDYKKISSYINYIMFDEFIRIDQNKNNNLDLNKLNLIFSKN